LEVNLRRVLVFAIVFVILLAILITYLTISRQKNTDKLVLSGVVESIQHDLSFRISGLTTEINYDEGDLVDSGAVVAVLDSSELVAAADQAAKNFQAIKANIAQLNVQLEMNNRNLQKTRELLKTGAANQNQMDDLSDQRRQIQAQLEFANKSLEAQNALVNLAAIRKSYTILKSPIKGKVISRQYQLGEVAMPGSPVITLADLDNLNIKVYLPEIYLGKVKLGQSVAIQVDSYPGNDIPGKIDYIADQAEFTPKNVQTKQERVKQVFALKITCSGKDGILKPGLPCDVVIPLK
jgi:HlyD family secretion protein